MEIFINIYFDRHCANMFYVYLMWSPPHSNWWHNFTPFYRLEKGCKFTGIHAVLSDLTFKLSTLSKTKYNVALVKYSKPKGLEGTKTSLSYKRSKLYKQQKSWMDSMIPF